MASVSKRARHPRPPATPCLPDDPGRERMPGVDTSARLPIVDEWFAVTWVTGRTAVLAEPHVDGLLRANLWYLRGRERDLLADTGNGIAPLRPVLERLARGRRRELVCVVTHAHADHIGGFHEFDYRLLQPAEREAAAHMDDELPLVSTSWPEELRDQLADSGFLLPPLLVDAVPDPGFDPESFRIAPVAPTHSVVGGDLIDLGGRRLQVIELPGHTRGSIGLLDEEEDALLSGDAVYEGGLIDTLPESDVARYRDTMTRLRELEVEVVYPGHGALFGRERLRELAGDYLRATR
jgi:glyoxylase-like metal-dependent hydrolase (beta-lactamase superfamily II)